MLEEKIETPSQQSEIAGLFDKYSPISGELLETYPCADESEVHQAYQLAQTAQKSWERVKLKKRAKLLKNFCALLHVHADLLAEQIHTEIGKPLHDALESDIAAAISIIRYTADQGRSQLKRRFIIPDLLSIITGRIHWETWLPRGVIGIIAPWNYPIAIPAGNIAAALMAGNAVLFKPSEHAPACGAYFIQLLRQALQDSGYSPDIVQLIQGDADTGQAVVNAPIDGLIFTGSTDVGQQLRVQTAQKGIWSCMELGGNDALLLIDGLMDLDWASSCVIWGRFHNAGQACAAIKHLYVPKRLYKPIISLLQHKISQLRVGPSRATIGHPPHACHLGPLISSEQREKLHRQVLDALSKGATLVTGGQRLTGAGYFYTPTLLTDLPPKAELLHEESFGPVLSVIVYDQVEEAIAQINASRYGLTTSILGPSEIAWALADQIQTATVVINELAMTNFALASTPWGGWKDSGYGSSHGDRGLTDLCKRQIVSESFLWHSRTFRKALWLFGRDERQNPTPRAHAVLSLVNRCWPSFEGLKALWGSRSSRKL